jgi:hypothetical protein
MAGRLQLGHGALGQVAALAGKKTFVSDRVSLRVVREPGADVSGYIYTQWYGGRPIVAVLPYRETAAGQVEFLLIDERVPCWPENGLSVVTGPPQDAEPFDDAVRKLAEETGFHADRTRWVRLGWCRDSKGSSVRYELFAVDVTGLAPKVGDGSALEAEAACVWLGLPDVAEVRHPIVHTIVLRLLAHLVGDGAQSRYATYSSRPSARGGLGSLPLAALFTPHAAGLTAGPGGAAASKGSEPGA